MSMCRVFSFVVGRGCLLWPVRSPDKTLLAFALLHSVLQGQICWLFQVSLDFLLLHSSPLWWKGHLFLVLVLEGLVGHHRTVQLSFRLQTEPDLPLSVWVSPAEHGSAVVCHGDRSSCCSRPGSPSVWHKPSWRRLPHHRATEQMTHKLQNNYSKEILALLRKF